MLVHLLLVAFVALEQGSCFLFGRQKRDYDPFLEWCGIEMDERQECGRKAYRLSKTECENRGCCFDENAGRHEISCFLSRGMLTEECDVAYEDKDDCGYYGIREAECLVRGCCFKPTSMPNDAICFKKKVIKAPVRLVSYDTESEKEGRVEVFYNDEWGTVCDDAFDDTDATVVCRQLGYDNGVARCCAEYGSGSGTIWMDQLDCNGDEDYLEDCGRNNWGTHDCSHSEDASVICYNDDEPRPTEAPSPYGGYYYYYNQYGSGRMGKVGNRYARYGENSGRMFRRGGEKKAHFTAMKKRKNEVDKKKALKNEKVQSEKKAMPLLQGIQNFLKKKGKQ